jgi:aspartyl protease family protein
MRILFIIPVFLATVFSGCTGCSNTNSRTNRKNSYIRVDKKNNEENIRLRAENEDRPRTIVKMVRDDGGVYKIPVEIDGTEMYFIFDTGAGMISISRTEANFLYKQGKLFKEDILGKANFVDANGDISEGTIINLKEVRLGRKSLYNIEASVVGNLTAPLLFGQSALEKFGKVSIDYSKLEITFE